MLKSFKVYLAILLMCIGSILPAVILTMPEEYMALPGSAVVFFAGGGLLYAIFKIAFDDYDDDLEKIYHQLPTISVVCVVVAIILQILTMIIYKDTSLLGIGNFLVEFNGDIGEFCLRLLSVIFSGLSFFPVFLIAIGGIDTSIYEWTEITIIDGVEHEGESYLFSSPESKVSYFFTAVLIASMGIVGNSLTTLIILLALTIGQFLSSKKKKAFVIIAIVVAVLLTMFSSFNVLSLTEVPSDAFIGIACENLPLVFAGLTYLFFVLYYKYDWIFSPISLIIAVFVMIFVSWIVSLLLSLLTIGVVSFIAKVFVCII